MLRLQLQFYVNLCCELIQSHLVIMPTYFQVLRVYQEQVDQLELQETQVHLVQEETQDPRVLMDQADQLVLRAHQVQ